MIEFLTSWVQGIIIAVIIATIIEMILPEGNSKKYIKVVIGVFILYNIITPVISKVSNGKIDLTTTVSKYFEDIQTKEVVSEGLENTNANNIKDIYITNLEKDMKTKLEAKGYGVKKIQITAKNDEKYTITKVELDVFWDGEKAHPKNEDTVSINTITVEVPIKDIKVGEDVSNEKQSSLEKKEKEEILKYMQDTYEIAPELMVIR